MVQEAKWQKRKKEGGYLVYARNRSTDSMASHLYLLTELNLTFFENVFPVYWLTVHLPYTLKERKV